jgi:hypothetical protein
MSAGGHQYQRLSDKDILDNLRMFQEEIDYFMRYVRGYPEDVQYVVCGLDTIDAIIRVDKRQFYFSVFHGMNINDRKKAALFAYWLVKFRPIKIVDDQHRNKIDYNDHVNELFAIHYLFSVLCTEGNIHTWDGSKGVKITLEHPYVTKLWYSLRFRNLTIDSMVVLADTINTETLLQAEKDEETGLDLSAHSDQDR